MGFRIFKFRRDIMGKGLVPEILERKPPTMVITKEWFQNDVHYITGNFKTPLFELSPELFPKGVETCHWKGIFPKDAKNRNGCVIHLAGTGDHTYFRREYGFANDLLKEGYGAVLIENPFYGTRKPDKQFNSSLINVSDLFVMGGCLIAECNFLLEWLKEHGHHTLGLSGVSMGGYMASLAASNVAYPIALVPLLSWTTAAPAYTEGALSEAINWPVLEAELASKSFRQAIAAIEGCDWLDQLAEKDKFHVSSDAKRFMWILMEEFTNLKMYPTPKATSLIKSIIAEEDAYVIRNDVPDLTEVWPGAQVQIIPGEGHVMAYIKSHSIFRKAISEMMQATQEYNDAGTKEPVVKA